MEKESTIDLTKFKEAQETIRSIQEQFCQMVIAEFEKKPVFKCGEMYETHSKHQPTPYYSHITVSGIRAELVFFVYPVNDDPKEADFLWLVKLACEELSIFQQDINPKSTVTLSFNNTEKKILLKKYAKLGEC